MDAATGQTLDSLRGHGQAITGLEFGPQETELWSMDRSGRLRCWDLKASRVERPLVNTQLPIRKVITDPQGKWFAVLPADQALTGQSIRSDAVASTLTAVEVPVFRTDDGQQLTSLRFPTHRDPMDHHFSKEVPSRRRRSDCIAPTDMAVAPSGTEVVVSFCHGVQQRFDPWSGRIISAKQLPPDQAGLELGLRQIGYVESGVGLGCVVHRQFEAMAVPLHSMQGPQLRTGPYQGLRAAAIGIWKDDDEYREVQNLKHHELLAVDLPRLRYVERIREPDGARIEVREACSGRTVSRLDARSDVVRRLHDCLFSEDGRWLLGVENRGTSIVWNVENGRRRFEQRTHSGRLDSVEFHPDATRILLGSSGVLQLWDLESGRELREFDGDGAKFLPDGRRLLIWDATGQIRMLDTRHQER